MGETIFSMKRMSSVDAFAQNAGPRKDVPPKTRILFGVNVAHALEGNSKLDVVEAATSSDKSFRKSRRCMTPHLSMRTFSRVEG